MGLGERKKKRVLLLCAGPNDRPTSLFNLLVAAGYDPVNYDLRNGQEFDLVDTPIWDRSLYDIASGEYMAGFASPDCSTFSKLHHLPGGQPFLRGLVGKDRYGLKKFPDGRPLTMEQREHVRIHTLVSVRVAEALDLFVARGVPCIFETP